MPVLKQLLFSRYGGFADKRIKNLDKGSVFVVDDRGDSDQGSGGQLYPWFCMIFADVQSNNRVVVSLRGNVPNGDSVQEWLNEHGLSIDTRHQHALILTVEPGQQELLEGLADAIEGLVARGVTYSVKSYKYVCPRAAESLRQLKGVLDEAWAGGRIKEGLGVFDD